MDAILDVLRTIAGSVISLAGLAAVAGGCIGLLRFPDFYTRVHAASVSIGAGATLAVLGLAVMAGDAATALRLLLLALLIAVAAPLLAHIGASTAHGGGLAPLSGRYSAPRPGAGRAGGDP